MGYDKTDLDNYRDEVKECLKKINKKQCAIWATDNNNGQIAYGPNGKRTDHEQIGQWAYAENRKGNGEMLKNTPISTH